LRVLGNTRRAPVSGKKKRGTKPCARSIKRIIAVAAGFVADGGAGHAVFHAAEATAEALGN